MGNAENIISSIAARAEKNAAINDGDFEAEGLIYCGKCMTPKQKRLNFPGVPVVWCLCKCEQKRRDAETEARVLRQRQAQIDALLDRLERYALIDPLPQETMIQNIDGTTLIKKQETTFADDDQKNPKATAFVKKYADNFKEAAKEGRGIVLYGTIGTGKSFLAECVISKLRAEHYAAATTSFRRVEQALWNIDDRQHALDLMTLLDAVHIDDLFAERDTEYMGEKVFALIDALYRAKVPMIVTTNLTYEQFKAERNMQKSRVLSRLYERCDFFEVKGADRRREIALSRSKPKR